MKMKTYTDLITNEEINNWVKGKGVFLNGGTGTGKTYFIVKTLAEKCREENKKILFLCNRDKLRNDVIEDAMAFNTSDIVTVTTYQAIQQKLIRGEDIERYDYITCDECHYFYDDATFVDFTDEIMDYITTRKNSVVIFMSATAEVLYKKLQGLNIITNTYTIAIDYSYVKELQFLSGKDAINIKVLELLENTDDKIIYFANSVKKAYEIYEQCKDKAYFYCSKGNKEYSKYSNYDCIKVYNKNLITFDKRILITTTVLDNGVTLKDKNIKHIITDVLDINKMQQCLGRKRIIDDIDWCNFYIFNYSNKYLGNYKGSLTKELNPAIIFNASFDTFSNTYLKGNKRFNNELLYINKDGNLQLNETKYNKYTSELANIELMLKFSYKAVILNRLGKSINAITRDINYEKVSKEDELLLYLESVVGKRLYKEEQKELIEKINVRVNGKQQRSYSKLNEGLKMIKLPYIIITDNDKRRKLEDGSINPNRDKKYWSVIKNLG